MIGAVVSACYGGWDTIKPLPATEPGLVQDWVMVTDDPQLIAPGWRVVYEPRPGMHPNLAAKVPKFRTDLYTDARADYTVWVDASAAMGPGFARMCRDAAAQLWGLSKIATFPHPHRVSLVDEVAVSRTLPKYNHLPLERQVDHYIREGYPDPYILRASGLIVRRDAHAQAHKRFGDAWLRECVRWGFQDQLSLSYLLWQEGWPVADVGPSLFTSENVTFGAHRDA